MPQPLPCLRCGYDLTGITHPICPECAAVITDETYRVIGLRNQLLQQRRMIIRRTLLILFGGMAVCLVGLPLLMLLYAPSDIFGINTLIEQIVAAAVGLTCVIGLSLVPLGLLIPTLPGPAKDVRPLIVLIWLKHLWLLHTPWLMIPIFAALLGAAELIFPKPSPALVILALVFFISWLILYFFVSFHWFRRLRQDLVQQGLNEQLRLFLIVGLGIGVLVASGLLGFVGGGMATFAIAVDELFPPQD